MALLNTTSKYITDPLRPNTSILNPNYLAPSNKTVAPNLGFQSAQTQINNAVSKPITAESLASKNTPVNVSGTVKDPNADKYQSILASIQSITAGIQATQASLNQYRDEEAKRTEQVSQQTTEQDADPYGIKKYMSDMDALKPVNKAENPAYTTAESDVTAMGKAVAENKNIVAQGNAKLAGIGAQIQQIVDATTVRKLEIGKEGISANAIAGRNNEVDRNAAIQALPLKSQALIVQSQIASDQGNLTEATDLLGQAKEALSMKFKLESDYETALYKWQSDKINAVMEYANSVQKSKLQQQQLENEQEFTLKRDELNYQRDLELKKIDALLKQPTTTPIGTDVNELSQTAQAVINGTLRLEDLTPTVRGNIAGELNSVGYKSGANLSSGQQDDLANMKTVTGLLDQILAFNADGKLEGIGSFGLGTLKSFFGQLGFSSEEALTVRTLIGNVKGTIAKLRGGTSFTPNEEKLLESYTPSINDSPVVAINKINNLKNYINEKNANLLEFAQERGVPVEVENLRAKYNY